MTKRKTDKPTKNSHWHPPTSSRHPHLKDTPPKQLEYLQHSIKKDTNNQPNGTKIQYTTVESWLTKDYDQKGENGRTTMILFNHHRKPLQPYHPIDQIIYLIHKEMSERIKRKHGETMTKIEKRKCTTPTCGRPLTHSGSNLVSLPIFDPNRPKNNQYIRHYNTVVMDVHT